MEVVSTLDRGLQAVISKSSQPTYATVLLFLFHTITAADIPGLRIKKKSTSESACPEAKTIFEAGWKCFSFEIICKV